MRVRLKGAFHACMDSFKTPHDRKKKTKEMKLKCEKREHEMYFLTFYLKKSLSKNLNY